MRYPHLTHPPLVAIAHGSRDPRAGATVTELLGVARERAASRGLTGLDIKAAFLDHAPPRPMQVLSALADEADRGGLPPLGAERRSGGSGAAAGRRPSARTRRSEPVNVPSRSRPATPASAGGRSGGSGGSPPRVDTVVLPLLLTAAYHSGTDIPGLLDEAQAARPGLRVRYGAPLGPHPGLLGALDRRLGEAGQDLTQAGQTAVVLAAAGSSHPAANAVIAQLAADWQAARGWQAVRPAFASAAAPTPEQSVAGLIRDGAQRVVVASYLLAPGRFADRVASASLAAGAAAVSAPLGAAADVADVLLDRYREALAEIPRERRERQVSALSVIQDRLASPGL